MGELAGDPVRMRRVPTAVVGIAAALALVVSPLVPGGELGAQEVVFVPRPDREAERMLATFLERDAYRIWDRDSIPDPSLSIEHDLLVLQASVRLANVVEGDVHVVDGDLFLRPGAVIRGDVVVLGGGFYRSGDARVEGEVHYEPNAAFRVLPVEGGYEVLSVDAPPRVFTPHGLYGLRLPDYQRVDGLTIEAGATARATGLSWQPSLEGRLRFLTEQERFEGTLRQTWHPSSGLRFGVEAERSTNTNEGWIRTDVSNSLSYLGGGGDHRNYHHVDRAALFVEGVPGPGWTPALSLRVEEARSVAASSLPVLFRDDGAFRPNPAVDPGETWSVLSSITYRDDRERGRAFVELRAEAADRDIAGDFSFVQGEARAALQRPALGDHILELFGILRGDLSGTLPRQRWSALGGRHTLPTREVLADRGPRLAFGRIGYYVPVEPLRVPVLGPPHVFLRDAIGTTWEQDGRPGFQNDVMAGVRFLFLEMLVAFDTGEEDLQATFLVGGALPGRYWW